jgi:S1-C subfamily serine protease
MDKTHSVFSLRIIKAKYDYCHPYKDFKEKKTRGSGFSIDIQNGLVLTNFHVIENAISINGRLMKTGKKDISMNVIGTCREKDLALLKINDMSLISNENIADLKFGDSMKLQPGETVIALGYPYESEDVKITSGLFSGFGVSDPDEKGLVNKEDSYDRCPTYLQISAPVNPGYSGGPLLNSKGEVIGIISSGYDGAQNIGYAIPSRTFLVIYPYLLKNLIVKMPNAGFSFCSTNRELMKLLTGTSSTYGIYVKDVTSDTCFDLLERGDIIRRLDYKDIFWGMKSDNKTLLKDFSDSDLEKGNLVTIFFDRFGISTKIGKLKNPNEINDDKLEFETIFTDRKMNLNQIMDMIPIGSELTLNICRRTEQNGELIPTWYKLNTKYSCVENNKERIIYAVPRWKSLQYEIFAGCCFTTLYKQHFSPSLDLDIDSSKDFNKYSVLITTIFPDSSASKTQSLRVGNIINRLVCYDNQWNTVIDQEIYDIADLKKNLTITKDKKAEYLQLFTSDHVTFIISISTMIQEDKYILQNFNIRHKYFFD